MNANGKAFSIVFSLSLLAAAAAARAVAPADADETKVRDLEAQSWVAWKAQDAKFFEGFLSADHVEIHGSGVAGKQDVVAAIAAHACDVHDYSLGKISAVRVSRDTILLSYRAEQDTQCGKGKAPSPAWVSSLYAKRGGTWLNVFYQQTPAH